MSRGGKTKRGEEYLLMGEIYLAKAETKIKWAGSEFFFGTLDTSFKRTDVLKQHRHHKNTG